jgi:preprotein translocase subunit SecA
MRIFASDTVKNMMGSLGIPEDEPIQSGIVTRTLESAQEKIEGVNFDSRKHVLGFDDVLNHQRTLIYGKRRAILVGAPEEIEAVALEHIAVAGKTDGAFVGKKAELGDSFTHILRNTLLQTYDMFWIEHLETMEHLRGSVNLRSYGGRDPFIEYRREGLRLFRDLENSLSVSVAEQIERLGAPQQGAREVVPRIVVSALEPGKDKIGRNDHVTITNGKETKEMKYKKAEPLLALGWKIVEDK